MLFDILWVQHQFQVKQVKEYDDREIETSLILIGTLPL